VLISPLAKAGILVEALPYIKKFSGRTVVIKYGGHAMVNTELKQAVMQDIILMKLVGINPIIVHGGGPEITAMLDKLAIKSSFVSGLRVTDAATMEVVEMVLVGKVNKDIVGHIQQLGGKAVGLSGKDGGLIRAVKEFSAVKGPDGQVQQVDLGLVGDVAEVNPHLVELLAQQGYIPVVAPVGMGEDGQSYNINADTMAGALAVALKADKLVLLTDVEGILRDFKDKNSLISSLSVAEVPGLIQEGIITGGMIPKVECCVKALQGGVQTTHIIDGRIPHSILLEVFTDKGIGTMVVA